MELKFCGRVTLMDTRQVNREQISALADGELAEPHFSTALADLRQAEGQASWDVYHQIGDVLRSDEMAFSLSERFAAKMSARLEAEPVIITPQFNVTDREALGAPVVVATGMSHQRFVRRFVVPGAAVAAAVVAVILVATPQQPMISAHMESAAPVPASSVSIATVTTNGASSQASAVSEGTLSRQGEVARDPRIDDYLLAHQHFSPSMYSSAQYARSAAFAVDSDK